MKAIIEIDMDNAAFDDPPQIEVARILKELAELLLTDGEVSRHSLYDYNGNKVGRIQVKD